MPSPYFTALPLTLLIVFALVSKGQDHAPSGLDNVSDKFVGSGPDQPVDHPATGNRGDHSIKSSRTSQPDDSKTLTGKVVGITDGDTVTVYTGQGKPIKLRLEGIDAPESKQDFGDASKRHLSGLVFSKNVVIHATGKDRYGRTLGVLYVSDKNVNAMMIRDGFAWHYKQYSSDTELADAEQSARAARRGLWAMANPVAPWEFRRKR